MPPVPLRVVQDRDEHTDALVEQSPFSSGPGQAAADGVDYACGGCGAVIWRREPSPPTPPLPEGPAQTARRVLIECPTCGAYNVLPPAGAGAPTGGAVPTS